MSSKLTFAEHLHSFLGKLRRSVEPWLPGQDEGEDEDQDLLDDDPTVMLLRDPRLVMSRMTYGADLLTNLAITDAIESGRASHPDELEVFWHPDAEGVPGVSTALTLVKKGVA